MAYEEFLEFAKVTALEAGEGVLMKNYGKMQELEWNLKQYFRTVVDKESDTLIRKRIKEKFPEHNIYSEENEGIDRNSEFSWVIDPLDGTLPYRYGTTDHFSVCIALARKKTPVVGVVYAPKRRELYFAKQNGGAFCNEKRIFISSEENIKILFLGLDGGKETEHFRRVDIIHYIDRFYSKDGISCFFASGCASVPLVLTASGKLHAYMALSLEPWDMAAAAAINREAGAKVTNIRGEEWTLDDKSIFAANPALHEKLFALLVK